MEIISVNVLLSSMTNVLFAQLESVYGNFQIRRLFVEFLGRGRGFFCGTGIGLHHLCDLLHTHSKLVKRLGLLRC